MQYAGIMYAASLTAFLTSVPDRHEEQEEGMAGRLASMQTLCTHCANAAQVRSL